ncbi:VOC family protein [Microbacterium telephonicum]|uniref:Lactoylglutathione lyase n=1 Tax=Microbacterium telephonicum TaxID=1714841 RepID=A0A498BUU2_9MICO|nr:VOC family protein [Microbacterium telephonicum]RLK46677.1 lactoylglutathione lyase [Microbacterium telephonicum]
MGVRSCFPILSTRDLPGLVDFYERALGGVVEYRFDQDGRDVYVALSIGGVKLGIGWDPQTPDAGAGDRAALWFYVDDVDAAFEAAVRSGAAVEAEPADMPWGERVARIRDPHGTLVNLGADA